LGFGALLPARQCQALAGGEIWAWSLGFFVLTISVLNLLIV